MEIYGLTRHGEPRWVGPLGISQIYGLTRHGEPRWVGPLGRPISPMITSMKCQCRTPKQCPLPQLLQIKATYSKWDLQQMSTCLDVVCSINFGFPEKEVFQGWLWYDFVCIMSTTFSYPQYVYKWLTKHRHVLFIQIVRRLELYQMTTRKSYNRTFPKPPTRYQLQRHQDSTGHK